MKHNKGIFLLALATLSFSLAFPSSADGVSASEDSEGLFYLSNGMKEKTIRFLFKKDWPFALRI